MLSGLNSANTIRVCFQTLTPTPSLWEGAAVNALRGLYWIHSGDTVVSGISCRAHPLSSHSFVLQQEPVNTLLLPHWWCPSLWCRVFSHLRKKKNVKILTSGLFLKSNNNFPYTTSVQLSNNIVSSWGKGRNRSTPSHLRQQKICTWCNHSFLITHLPTLEKRKWLHMVQGDGMGPWMCAGITEIKRSYMTSSVI